MWRSWHPNGAPRSEEPFEAGALSGVIKTWFAGGALESEVNWSGGFVISGQQWFEDGGLREKGAGSDGLFECWYEGGQLMQQGELKSGLRVGPWSFFKADGTPDVEMSGVYEAGTKETAR
jgi:antitoxin component YwqK of YwqJK toxin-antitoxin module